MNKIIMRFLKEEDGLGTVEIVVIIAVLVGIALVFRKAIMSFVNQILDKVFYQSGDVIGTPVSGTDIKDRKIR